jgi:hypothetical protein
MRGGRDQLKEDLRNARRDLCIATTEPPLKMWAYAEVMPRIGGRVTVVMIGGGYDVSVPKTMHMIKQWEFNKPAVTLREIADALNIDRG